MPAAAAMLFGLTTASALQEVPTLCDRVTVGAGLDRSACDLVDRSSGRRRPGREETP